ncbi:unnamed protein product, partial [Meganyctiphanes norvegica]
RHFEKMQRTPTLLRLSTVISTSPSNVPVRLKSRVTRLAPGTQSHEKALWSNGEVFHPGRKDCPLGNKDQYPQDLPDGGKQYFGFKYYPRYAEQQDPTDFEPAPLHLVTRTRCLKRKPWWDRDTMKLIGLGGKRSDVSVLKNNPENNALLWKVKHMVKVTPLRVPTNLPKDIDPKDCFIKETGEFYHIPKIGIPKEKLVEDAKLTKPAFDGDHLLKEARKRWQDAWEVKMK